MGGAPPPAPPSGARPVTSLSVLFPTVFDRPLRAEASVANPGTAAGSFTLEGSLWQDATTLLDTLSAVVEVPSGGRVSRIFDFGLRPAGTYQVRARVLQQGTTMESVSQDVTVLASEAQLKAARAQERLAAAARFGYDQVRDVVAASYADSAAGLSKAALSSLVGALTEPLNGFGEVLGVEAGKIAETSADVELKLLGVESFIEQTTRRGVEQHARPFVDRSLVPERLRAALQAAEFRAYANSETLVWNDGRLSVVVGAREQAIRNRVALEPIPRGLVKPVRFLGPTTLLEEAQAQAFYRSLNDALGKLATAAVLLTIVVAVVGLFHLTVPALLVMAAAAGPAIAKVLTVVTQVVPILLLLTSVLVHTHAQRIVAPAITREHGDALRLLETLTTPTGATAVSSIETKAAARGREVDIQTSLAAGETASPVVETCLYTADGRVARVFDALPSLAPGRAQTLVHQAMLPPGSFRAATVVHAGGEIAAGSSQTDFTVEAPSVGLGLWLARSRLAPGEPVVATVTVTNTSAIAGTGSLAVLVQASTGDFVDVQELELGSGQARTIPLRFVPQTGGAALRAVVLDANRELGSREVGYVVGAGPAVALDVELPALSQPGDDVIAGISIVNAGTVPTTTVLGLTAIDAETGRVLATRPLTLTLEPDQPVVTSTVVLPAAGPGAYVLQVEVGGRSSRTVDFVVAAHDTLYAAVAAGAALVPVGQPITLTASVVNSVFTYTTAALAVTLKDPTGLTQTVPLLPIDVGQVQGWVTPTITGTYQVFVSATAPGYRINTLGTAFAAGQSSRLQPLVSGSPVLGQTSAVTVTVANEQQVPLPDASVVISSPVTLLGSLTDAAGSAVFTLAPTNTVPYTVTLTGDGYGTTVFLLPVQVISDTTPPAVFFAPPALTNRTPLTVTGLTEPAAALTAGGITVTVDALGRFTATLALAPGPNEIVVSAEDGSGNRTTVTRTVTLDTVSPALILDYPPEGFVTASDVISVTGRTEVSATVTVSGTILSVDPATGAFGGWLILGRGSNTVPVSATDPAGNTMVITRTVTHTIPDPAPLVPITYDLSAGWNLISPPFSPTVPFRAGDLVGSMAQQGITVTHVARWQNGAWQSYLPGFGPEDFPLEFGRGYFVRTASGGRWRLGP